MNFKMNDWEMNFSPVKNGSPYPEIQYKENFDLDKLVSVTLTTTIRLKKDGKVYKQTLVKDYEVSAPENEGIFDVSYPLVQLMLRFNRYAYTMQELGIVDFSMKDAGDKPVFELDTSCFMHKGHIIEIAGHGFIYGFMAYPQLEMVIDVIDRKIIREQGTSA